MDSQIISGVLLTPLKKIYNPKGDIYHGMKNTDIGFNGFSEAYFSTINYGDIKPWKKHLSMTLNFIVPVGNIKFVIYDDRKNSTTYNKFFEIIIGENNYQRITIPPDLWVAFQGVDQKINLLLNIANLQHNPEEMLRLESVDEIYYKW